MFLCKFVEENLKSYADNKTGFLKSLLIREHIESCMSCRGKLESIKGIKLPPTQKMGDIKKQVKDEVNKVISDVH
jgi:hypothetical protein